MADDSDAAFPTSPFAFGAPGDSPFAEADQAAQAQSQVQGQFEQARSRRNYIQAISKGASTKQGAVRSGVTGNG